MSNLNREVWEGWTVQNFIDELQPMLDVIMSYGSFIVPFKTKKEMAVYIRENQPYYKKTIPEVNDYFAKRYGLR